MINASLTDVLKLECSININGVVIEVTDEYNSESVENSTVDLELKM